MLVESRTRFFGQTGCFGLSIRMQGYDDSNVEAELDCSDRAIACVAAAGYDAALFTGHSVRAGVLTSAARAGASVFKMQEQSRHKSIQALSAYVRDARIFHDHAGKDFL